MNVKAEIEAGRTFVASLPDVADFTLIGSATFMPDESVGDIDFLVLLKDGRNAVDYANSFVRQDGWESCGEYDTETGTWDSIRLDSLNLVITSDAEFYERFKRAMEVCKGLRLTNKADRIAVCRMVRDGWAADVALPPSLEEIKF